jgi:hypothetical protein
MAREAIAQRRGLDAAEFRTPLPWQGVIVHLKRTDDCVRTYPRPMQRQSARSADNSTAQGSMTEIFRQ